MHFYRALFLPIFTLLLGVGCPQPTPVRLQLQWLPQAQFAGFYAAKAKGYYGEQNLDVTLLPATIGVAPQDVLAKGGAEFAVAWLPKVLVAKERGADLVHIAQLFQRSSTVEVSWKEKNILKVADWKGKKIGSWLQGNEYELIAAMKAANLDPQKDVTLVKQTFDMVQLVTGKIDAAQAQIFNELALLLETPKPNTDQLVTLADLNVISMQEVGAAMLQDGIYAQGTWLKNNEDVAVRFLRATIQGWMYCRDHAEECVDIVLAVEPNLPKTHQRWMMNEVNALIWPSPDGIGVVAASDWERTAQIALDAKVIKSPPAADAIRRDLLQKALTSVDGDTAGKDFKKAQITLTPGGV